MTFEREENITKVGIEDIEIVFFVPGDGSPEKVQYGVLNIKILRSDGSLKSQSFDLLDRLKDDAEGLSHLQNLTDLKSYILSRLNAEVLPL